eukprot:scaffold7451_cov185-Amphora_coffeaeformis.AAC.2
MDFRTQPDKGVFQSTMVVRLGWNGMNMSNNTVLFVLLQRPPCCPAGPSANFNPVKQVLMFSSPRRELAVFYRLYRKDIVVVKKQSSRLPGIVNKRNKFV